jgi:hypothetical protein
MKGILLSVLLILSTCGPSAVGSSASPSLSTEAAAVEVTKKFWKVSMTVLASGDIEPLAQVCERESVAWANTRSNLLDNEYRGVVSINTQLRMTDFRVKSEQDRISVVHRLDLRGYESSASTRKPLEPEQTLPSQRSIVWLKSFGGRLLVTYVELGPWG